MARHFHDPLGNLLAVACIQRVYLAEGRGVLALDARQKPVLWIEEPEKDLAIRIRDILIQIVLTKGRVGDPDWSFLRKDKKVTKA